MPRIIALIALMVVLALVNWSIYKKEQHLEKGQVVFLKLVPVDPRSLMQGDYMALRFEMARKIDTLLDENVDSQDGLVVVTLDEKRVGSFARLSQENETVKEEEMRLQYRVRNRSVKFATNAFFFEEGMAKKYEKAKYGEFRANHKGELLLVAMADENVTVIE